MTFASLEEMIEDVLLKYSVNDAQRNCLVGGGIENLRGGTRWFYNYSERMLFEWKREVLQYVSNQGY